MVGLDPDCLLSRLGSRGYPVRLRPSETKIAVDKGAAFSRACASVTGSPSWRRPITHTRRARTATSITINPATSSSTATIGHIFPYQSGCCVGELAGHADIRGSGRNGAERNATAFAFANRSSEHGAILLFAARVSIGGEEWRRAWRRESRLLARVRRAAWRREMSELERTWAIASAHADGVSLRKIAAAAGLGPTRVHAIARDADLNSLDAALAC
jgi:hypothetical protein